MATLERMEADGLQHSVKDDDDVIMGKVFMQKFRERSRVSHPDPQVLFRDAPLSRKTQMPRVDDDICYITFVLSPPYQCWRRHQPDVHFLRLLVCLCSHTTCCLCMFTHLYWQRHWTYLKCSTVLTQMLRKKK